jgi:hypothetical protein
MSDKHKDTWGKKKIKVRTPSSQTTKEQEKKKKKESNKSLFKNPPKKIRIPETHLIVVVKPGRSPNKIGFTYMMMKSDMPPNHPFDTLYRC